MSAPSFLDTGLLPPGVHEVSLLEAQLMLCVNPVRAQLWAEFISLIKRVQQAGDFFTRVLIDSAFVTQMSDPDGVTIALVFKIQPGDSITAAELAQTLIALKSEYPGIQVFPHPESKPIRDIQDKLTIIDPVEMGESYLHFPTTRKGILSVMLHHDSSQTA